MPHLCEGGRIASIASREAWVGMGSKRARPCEYLDHSTMRAVRGTPAACYTPNGERTFIHRAIRYDADADPLRGPRRIGSHICIRSVVHAQCPDRCVASR